MLFGLRVLRIEQARAARLKIPIMQLFAYPDVLRLKIPFDVSVQGWSVNTFGNVDALCQLTDVFQGSLDTCKEDKILNTFLLIHRWENLYVQMKIRSRLSQRFLDSLRNQGVLTIEYGTHNTRPELY